MLAHTWVRHFGRGRGQGCLFVEDDSGQLQRTQVCLDWIGVCRLLLDDFRSKCLQHHNEPAQF
jgi:hypothetical protein